MRLVGCLVILLAIFAETTFSAVARGNYNDPKNPGKCTIENLILSPGDKVKDPKSPCAQIICGKGGDVVFHTCGVMHVEGCKLGGYINTSLNYPDCCKRHVICN